MPEGKANILFFNTNVIISILQVFFIWVTRTQKQYEWFTEIIHEAEENDRNQKLEVHTFITQFFDKFDLRTTMLVSVNIATVISQCFSRHFVENL